MPWTRGVRTASRRAVAPGWGTIRRAVGQPGASRGLGRCGCMLARETRRCRDATRYWVNAYWRPGRLSERNPHASARFLIMYVCVQGRRSVAGALVPDAASSTGLKTAGGICDVGVVRQLVRRPLDPVRAVVLEHGRRAGHHRGTALIRGHGGSPRPRRSVRPRCGATSTGGLAAGSSRTPHPGPRSRRSSHSTGHGSPTSRSDGAGWPGPISSTSSWPGESRTSG